jgi:hypothetical protein
MFFALIIIDSILWVLTAYALATFVIRKQQKANNRLQDIC